MSNAFDTQVGGGHYKDMTIQPMEFALANNLNYGQANAVKYICRYPKKNGIEDLKKAIHCIELLIAHEEAQAAKPNGRMFIGLCPPSPMIFDNRIDVIGQNGNDGDHYVDIIRGPDTGC